LREITLPNCTVGFVYNEPCPLKCDFCCHTKENVGPGHLTVENVLPMVLGYSRNVHVSRFAFTGGDPFIYIKDILAIFERAREEGVDQPFHIVTSAFWAKSDSIVDRILAQLSKLQMDRLYVSYDLEHRRWVPEDHIYRVERYCKKYGIELCVYGIFWDETTTVRDLLPELRVTRVETNLVAPIGRARTAGKKIPTNRNAESKYSCGRPQDYDITVYPNGETFPCCSGGFNKEAKLSLGNSFTENPDRIIERCFSHFFVIVAKEIGFDKLYAKLTDRQIKDLSLPRFEDSATVCEICSQIHGNSRLRDALRNVLSEMEVDYCLDRLSAIEATSDRAERATEI
jgi:MoaA/NifB/PqqE/SkfB family radical SAM enzyme